MKSASFLSLFFILGSFLNAGVPSTLNYQGRVLQNGQPFEGTGNFVFIIYEGGGIRWSNKTGFNPDATDPLPNWASAGKALAVRNGIFSVQLGSGDASGTNEPIPTSVFFEFDGTQRVRTDVKLKVWFSPAAEGPYTKLEPDITFASVPFAQVAGVAEGVMDGKVTSNSLAPGASVGNIGSGGVLISREQINPGIIGAAQVEDSSLGRSELDAATRESLSPVGEVTAFAGATPPSGWLRCDGSQVSRATYANLYSVIGTTHGSGNGSTTFHLPDYRGRFLRMGDYGSGRDEDRGSRTQMNSGGSSGDALGSVQADQFKSHTHGTRGNPGCVLYSGPDGVVNTYNNTLLSRRTEAEGGSETRPENAYIQYIIKY